jgi:4-hydroxybenzoate polyprenyltransferase
VTGRAGGLLVAAHPLPAAAVTAFATAYAAALGAGPARLALVAAAVLTGQLCVGWSNDALDAGRDRAAGRGDKPVGTGLVGRRPVAVAAVAAGLACVPLSLALGAVPGVAHLVAVGAALGYNLGLKATPASPLPYLLAFGLLPVVTTLAVTPGAPLPWPQVAAAALLGAGAHAANTVGDAAADELTGVRGLPQRLGPRRSLVATAVLVAAGALVLLLDTVAAGVSATARDVAGAALLGGGALLGAAGAAGGAGLRGGRTAFRLTLAAIALVVVGFLLTA